MKSLRHNKISGFFSRLSAKKRLDVTVSVVAMESVDEDEISAEEESHLSAVCANVMRNMAIKHPIVSLYLNIEQKRTLTTLRVDMLRDMCIDRRWAEYFTSEEEKSIHRTTNTISTGVYPHFQ